MAGTEENAAPTRVAILEPRRLLCQALSLWLSHQSEVELVGSSASPGTIDQLCEAGRVDVTLVGLAGSSSAVVKDAANLARRYPDMRMIALLDGDGCADLDTQDLLDFGFRAAIAATGGTLTLLRVIRPGTVANDVTSLVPEPSPLGPLTEQEAEVLSLVGSGSTAVDISEQLGVSTSTVANHKGSIFNKLDARNQAHAVARAVSMGLIAPEHVDPQAS